MWDFRTILQCQGSEMSLRIFEDFSDGYITFSTLAVEPIVVVMTAVSQSR